MSWFDASGFANLAKSALKEAQKTIDKALDIKEEEQKASGNRAIDDVDFFSSFNFRNDSKTGGKQPVLSTPTKQETNLWGSFSGSFFEAPKTDTDAGIQQPRRSESLHEQLERSHPECSTLSQSISLPEKFIHDKKKSRKTKNEANKNKKSFKNSLEEKEDVLPMLESETNVEVNEKTGLEIFNKISSISSGSDKRSSESVEILGSCSQTNTNCTTTPDSEIISGSNSLSFSAVETKKHSESVEILPDSSNTSPSSVEILKDNSIIESSFLSPFDDSKSLEVITTPFEPDSEAHVSLSDISSYASPMSESKSPIIEEMNEIVESSSQKFIQTALSIDKSYPGVKGCQHNDELDEISQAEDSYTSVSESTAVMTVMESFHQSNQHETILENPESQEIYCDASSLQDSNSRKDVKQSLYLPLEPITTQPIQKAECLTEKVETYDPDFVKSTTIELPNLDIPENASQEQISAILTDSSCEGTLIETSSEDNAIFRQIIQSHTLETETVPLTSSSYVKNMLADAMTEKGELVGNLNRQTIDVPPRENSPISSESRSDLVKIGSDHASGHTSGDELETTTSSDIEIISSPNGDSSSTQSRQSPANLHSNKSGDLLTKALKTRGHSRELSEISIGSDATNFEIEKLLKRIQEMNEILEVRESKLIDVGRMNMELHEQNNHLKMQLGNWEKKGQQHQALHLITDEYTQRMSAIEKKFQQSIKERDILKDQLEVLKKEMSPQLLIANDEKDELIKQLRDEGEKLSKQQLQHSNIIKKLRSKEKESDGIIKNQEEQIETLSSELERLKRSLNAKEEVERSQIEAVHTLTARVKKQEKDNAFLQEKLTTALEKMNAYKTNLDAAKSELVETRTNYSTAEKELKQALNNASESYGLMAQVTDLKMKLRSSEENHVKHVDLLKQENNDLLHRLESVEARNEELSESISTATKPLLRQLEQLQGNFTQKSKTFIKQEKIMSEKIDELQAKLENMLITDRSLIEENSNLKLEIIQLESQLKRKESEKINIQEKCDKLKRESDKLTKELEDLRVKITVLEDSNRQEVKALKREIESLGVKLSVEKAAIDAEKRKNHSVLEQQLSVNDDVRISPTVSVRRDSMSSTNSFSDTIFETSSGRLPNLYDGLRGSANTTSTIENLQAQLKSREGEIQMLQWEISRRNNERDALNMELSNLSMKVDELSPKLIEVETLNANLNEIQTRYDALLQMYGEKVEENEELRLDLEDVKEMYKSQIDQLLKRDAT